jgi:cobalt-zinc-cadmium efflux system outer membrane protein
VALAVEIRSEVRRWKTMMLSARRRAEYYRTVALPRRKRVVDEMQKEYNGMLIGVFQLLQAKRDEVNAGWKYVGSLTDYWVDHSELERAIGADLPIEGAMRSPAATEPQPVAPAMHHQGG